MERKSEITKSLLGVSFKELVIKHPFEKITIKMITDGANVIRPTFYNYFQDKYAVIEWLLDEEIFKNMETLINAEMESEALKLLLKKIEADKLYYQKLFQIIGQNSFEEMLTARICSVIMHMLKRHSLKLKDADTNSLVSLDIFIRYQTLNMVTVIKYWIMDHNASLSADDALEIYRFLATHSLMDIIDG